MPVWDSGAATAAMWGELSEPTLYSAQAERYSRSDLVYMCVNRVAQMAAMNAHRLQLFNPDSPRDDETGIPTERITDHPFLKLWSQPNAWDSQFEFTEGTAVTLQLAGNSYWHIDDGEPARMEGSKKWVYLENEPLALWGMRPDRVWIEADKQKYISAYRYEVAGENIYVSPRAVRHHKYFHPLRDMEGMSPLEAANFASASDIASQKSNYYLFRNGLRLSAVVESDRETIDPQQMQLMEKMFLERYTGSPEKAYQVAFLWSAFKLRELGMNMRDAEFIEGSKMNRMRIFGVFGVHPAVVLAEDVNLANANVGEYVTLKYTVAPLLTRIASEITPMLLPEERNGLGLWKDAPAAEAHFVGVVPQDREGEAKVADSKANATQKLVQALGPEEGVAEAKRLGVLSEDVDPAKVVPMGGAGAGLLSGPSIGLRPLGASSGDGSGKETGAKQREFFRNYP